MIQQLLHDERGGYSSRQIACLPESEKIFCEKSTEPGYGMKRQVTDSMASIERAPITANAKLFFLPFYGSHPGIFHRTCSRKIDTLPFGLQEAKALPTITRAFKR